MSEIYNNISEIQTTDTRLRLITIVAGTITACVGGIILAGWFLGFYNIFNFGKNWIPMADETAFLFLVLGVVLVVGGKSRNNRKLRYYIIGTAIFIVITSLLTLIDFSTNYNYNVSNWLIRKQEMIGGILIGKPSIITAIWFIFTSVALLLLRGKAANISAYFGFFNLFVGYVIVHGYMYGVPLLYGGTLIPVSLPTAITFMISSVGLIAYAGQDVFPLKYFLGISTQARLMRNFLSAIFLIELIQDLIEVNFASSHQTMNAFINSIVDIFAFIAFGYVIWLLSRSIGNSIDKNIDERKRAVDALRESEEKLRTLVENMGEGLGLVDENEVFIFTNPAAEKLFGVKSGEFVGMNVSQFNTPEKFEIIKHQTAIRKQGETSSYEYEIIRPNGERRDIIITATPRFNNMGQYVGSQAIFRDITEQKLALEELKRLNEELIHSKKLVDDSLVQKNEFIEKLENSQEKLKQTNDEKDKFFSIIAHDLKSPFSGFLGLTKIMAEQMQELSMKELQQYSKSLKESASGLYKLLENLLEWSRMQRGMISFNPENVSLSKMIEQNIGLITDKAKQKEIILNRDVLESINVFADVQMLNTVLRNLISNAVKFTNHGGTVQVSSKIIENDFVCISIKDSGIGMNKVTLGKLFHVDEKVSRPGTDGESSTGLGLLLCKEFIEKNGGKIWVESEEDKGSTFYFTMPAKQEKE